MNKLEKSVHHIQHMPSWLRTIIMLPPLLLVIYWTISFSGLYRYYTNIQLKLNGEYDSGISFLLVFISIMFPATFVLLYIAYRYYSTNTTSPVETILPKKKTLLQKIGILSNKATVWFAVYSLLLGIAILIAGIQAITFVSSYSISSKPVIIDIHNNTLVKENRKEFIRIKGFLDCNDLQTLQETTTRGSTVESVKTSYFIPLYTRDGNFSSIFLEKNIEKRKYGTKTIDNFNCVDGETTFQGIISGSKLPGIIRDAYIENAILKEEMPYLILNLDRANGPIKNDYRYLFISLLCILLLGLLEWRLQLLADKNFE